MDFKLAAELGVSQSSVVLIGAAWSAVHKAWAFPMRDGDGKVVGIRLRESSGNKYAVTGSQSGIFMHDCFPAKSDKKLAAYLPEGPTDTMALISLGFFAIGRPSCNSGGEYIKHALKRLGIHRAVIVADNDELKTRPDGTTWRPGIDGARKLKRELDIASCIWMPPAPFKDLREFYRNGGTREMIESEINKKIWSKK